MVFVNKLCFIKKPQNKAQQKSQQKLHKKPQRNTKQLPPLSSSNAKVSTITISTNTDEVYITDVFPLLECLTEVIKSEFQKRLLQFNKSKTYIIRILFWMNWFVTFINNKPLYVYVTRTHQVKVGDNKPEDFIPLLGDTWWAQDYDAHAPAECADTNNPPLCITHKTTIEIVSPIKIRYKCNELTITGKRRIVLPGGLRYVDIDLQ